MPDPMTTPGRQAIEAARQGLIEAVEFVATRSGSSNLATAVRAKLDAYERALAEQPREEREDDLLRVECEKRGLPVDLATLLRHIENNHAATRGAMQDQIDNWKSRAEQPRGEERAHYLVGTDPRTKPALAQDAWIVRLTQSSPELPREGEMRLAEEHPNA